MNQRTLWAPWRRAYLEQLLTQEEELCDAPPSAGSFLASYWGAPSEDEQNHVIHRDAHGMILLNRYPYANGHLLVALGDPRPSLLDYDEAQRRAFWSLVDRAMAILERGLTPQGVNVGINQGRAAGAGVPEHLHAHLVPRWNADTNFITVVGQVRIIPDALTAMDERLRATNASLDGT